MLGEQVGSYRIINRVAAGGMGVVYRAEHTLIGKIAAVKLLRKEVSEKPKIVKRFFDEARATTKIRHPGIVEIFDFGYHSDGRAYIIMEFLDGETLKRRIRSHGIFRADEAMPILRHVASAVGAAHDAGVVHRDLKPDNIFLVPDPDLPGGERTRVLDFGLAKLFDDSDDSEEGKMVTRSGAVMGTPTYMAPEQCKGAGEVDHRVDIYSMGCILFELMCGRPPFVAAGVGELIGAHLHKEVTPPRHFNPVIHPALETTILRMLAKDPAKRYRSMAQLRAALDREFPESDATDTEVGGGMEEDPTRQLRIRPATARSSKISPAMGWPAAPSDAGQQSSLSDSAAQVVALPPITMASTGPRSSLPPERAHRVTGSGDYLRASVSPSGSHAPLTGSYSDERRSPIRWIIGGGAGILLGMALALVAIHGLDNEPPALQTIIEEPVPAAATRSTHGTASVEPPGIGTNSPGAATDHDPTDHHVGDAAAGVAVANGEKPTDHTAAPEGDGTGDGDGSAPDRGATSVAASDAGEVSPADGAAKRESGDAGGVETGDRETDARSRSTRGRKASGKKSARSMARDFDLSLRIRPTSARATVKIDGAISKSRSVTLKRGAHRIHIAADGYNSVTRTIKLNRDRTIEVDLVRKKPELPFDPGL